MKNKLDEINSKLNIAEGKKTTNLKAQKQKLLKMKHREKTDEKSKWNNSQLWGNFRQPVQVEQGSLKDI